MTTLRAGTSGFSYKEWKGSFYPEDLPAKKMLEHYAGRLPTVEINNTFYRMPKDDVLAGWHDRVPETFRFSIKASRRITHLKRLGDVAEEVAYLYERLESLGDRLGVVLFQTPPFLKKDVERLRAFVGLLPDGARAAFEFRSETWDDPEVFEILSERRLAWVVSDVDDADEPEPVMTAPYGYLRLRRTAYDDETLRRWLGKIRAAGWEETYVFFKHEDEGTGPRLAAKFLELAAG